MRERPLALLYEPVVVAVLPVVALVDVVVRFCVVRPSAVWLALPMLSMRPFVPCTTNRLLCCAELSTLCVVGQFLDFARADAAKGAVDGDVKALVRAAGAHRLAAPSR